MRLVMRDLTALISNTFTHDVPAVTLVSCPRNNMAFVAIKMGRRLGKGIGGSVYRRIGVWGSKTAFSTRLSWPGASKKLMTLFKRPHADPPIRRYVSPRRQSIFIATLRAGWLFFSPAAAGLTRPG